MVAGHAVEDDGKTWTITLRDGLELPRRRAGAGARRRRQPEALGVARRLRPVAVQPSSTRLSAPDDRTVRWRLKRPFPLLPMALGKVGAIVAFIMPERLAQTDSAQPVKELIGSGPFRFLADEHVPGSRLVYHALRRLRAAAGRRRRACSPGRRSRISTGSNGRSSPIPRPRPRRCSAARSTGGISRSPICCRRCKANKALKVELLDPIGNVGVLRFNHPQPPFDNPAIRRAVLPAINQTDFMTAVAGDDQQPVARQGRLLRARLDHGERRGHGGAQRPARHRGRGARRSRRPATRARRCC